jgi:hypothetical protein
MPAPLTPIVLIDHAVKSNFRTVIGCGVTFLALISGSQEQALFWAQMTSYGIGVTVGLATLWSIWSKRHQNGRRGR